MPHATAIHEESEAGPYAGLTTADLLDLAQRAARALGSPTGVLPAAGAGRTGADPGPSVGLRPGLVVSTSEADGLWREVLLRTRAGDEEATTLLCGLVGDPARLSPTGLSRAEVLDAIADRTVRRRAVEGLRLSTSALVALRSGVPDGPLRQTLDELLIVEAERRREPALVRLLQRSSVAVVATRAHLVEGASLLSTLEELRRRPADGGNLGRSLEAMATTRTALERWGERMGATEMGPEHAQQVAELRTKANAVGRSVREGLGQRVLADLRELTTKPVTHLPTWEARRARAVNNARYWVESAPTSGPLQLEVQRLLAREATDGRAWGRRSAMAVRRAQQRVRAAEEWWEVVGLLSGAPIVAGLLLLRLLAIAPVLGAVASVAMFGFAQQHRRLLRDPDAWVAFYVAPPLPADR